MIELNKETICIGETRITAFSHAYCEADIIVPDVKPDISRVLQVNANVVIGNKSCSADKVSVDGKVHMNILYIGDDGNIKCIVFTEPFSHMMDADGAMENMDIELESDIENIDYTIVNSRKLFVKVLIGIDVNVTSKVESFIPTDIKGDIPFEVLRKTIKPYSVVAHSMEEIAIRDRLELPSGKPSISNILSLDVKIKDKETKLVNNKIILKGNLNVTTVYLGDMGENDIQTMENEVPFTEILEAEGATEEMSARVNLNNNQLFYEADEDSDGDSRVINLECTLIANATVYSETPIDIIEDAYCITKPFLISRQSDKINRVVADVKAQATLKDLASIPADLPEIMQVYNVIAKPYISNTKIEMGKVIVEGVIDTHILYTSSDKDHPLCAHKHEHKFSQYINVDNISEDMTCDVSVDIEHINYNISMGHEVDLRFIIGISVRIICVDNVDYITDIMQSEEEMKEEKPSSCIKIYFVKKGDRMWDIAKRYHTTMENIMSSNNINSESELVKGKQILIP